MNLQNELLTTQLDWNLITLYGSMTTVFLIYEWYDKNSLQEFKLTFIKFFGILLASIFFHILVNIVLGKQEQEISNAYMSGVIIYLLTFIFNTMVQDTKHWKKIKREFQKEQMKKQENAEDKVKDLQIDKQEDFIIDLDFSKMKKDE